MIKVNFLGDSITEGAITSKEEYKFVNQVINRYPLIGNNYGIGGTRIARQKEKDAYSENNFLARIDAMDKDADFVFVFGGTNDYGHGMAPIGELNSFDEYTFTGAFNSLLNKLIKIYGKDKICVILPLHRYQEDSPYGSGHNWAYRKRAPLSTYVDLMIKISDKYDVDILDLRSDFPIPKKLPTDLTNDGLHPNDKGHTIIANRIIEYLKNRFK